MRDGVRERDEGRRSGEKEREVVGAEGRGWDGGREGERKAVESTGGRSALHTHTDTYTNIYMRYVTYVSIYTYMYVCMYVCIYIYMYIYVYI